MTPLFIQNLDTPLLPPESMPYNNWCVQLYGNDYITIPKTRLNFIPQVDAFSIAFWFKQDASDNGFIIAKRDFTNVQYSIYTDGDYFYTNVGAGSDIRWDDPAYPNCAKINYQYTRGTWIHFCLTVPTGTSGVKVYINGQQQTLVNGHDAIGANNVTANAYDVQIGTETGINLLLKAQLDEIAFWNRELNQSEVTNVMAGELPTPVAWYRFENDIVDGKASTIIHDSSGYNTNATFTNPVDGSLVFNSYPTPPFSSTADPNYVLPAMLRLVNGKFRLNDVPFYPLGWWGFYYAPTEGAADFRARRSNILVHGNQHDEFTYTSGQMGQYCLFQCEDDLTLLRRKKALTYNLSWEAAQEPWSGEPPGAYPTPATQETINAINTIRIVDPTRLVSVTPNNGAIGQLGQFVPPFGDNIDFATIQAGYVWPYYEWLVVYTFMQTAIANASNKPCIAIIEHQGYQLDRYYLKLREKTAVELRLHAYLLIAAGAVGLIFYPYNARSTACDSEPILNVYDTEASPDYFNTLTALITELSERSPIFLEADSPLIVTTDNDHIVTKVWRAGTDDYILVCNATTTQNTSHALQKPANVDAKVSNGSTTLPTTTNYSGSTVDLQLLDRTQNISIPISRADCNAFPPDPLNGVDRVIITARVTNNSTLISCAIYADDDRDLFPEKVIATGQLVANSTGGSYNQLTITLDQNINIELMRNYLIVLRANNQVLMKTVTGDSSQTAILSNPLGPGGFQDQPPLYTLAESPVTLTIQGTTQGTHHEYWTTGSTVPDQTEIEGLPQSFDMAAGEVRLIRLYRIVSTMAAYASIPTANSFFSTRLNTEAWDSADSGKQTKALAQATDIINQVNYVGNKQSVDQINEFPRDTDPDANVQQAVIDACCLIALSLLEGNTPERDMQQSIMAMERHGNTTQVYRDTFLEHVALGIPSIDAWRKLKPWIRDVNDFRMEKS